MVHFVEIQWTMITTCICIKRYAEESFTIAVAFIYSYRISLFHPIRIVSDSEPNEIKLNKWISRNRSPAIFISNEAIQSRSRCYVNTVAWITVEHSHYPKLTKPNRIYYSDVSLSKRFIIGIKLNFLRYFNTRSMLYALLVALPLLLKKRKKERGVFRKL